MHAPLGIGCLLLLLAALGNGWGGEVEVDPALPDYLPLEGITGTVSCVGSDSLNNLLTFWAEGFQELHPSTSIQIEGKGGSSAPAALVSGLAQIGPMTREMLPQELAAFERKWGYPPTAVKVAVDALVVIVHPDHPLRSLTMTQVDSLFSSTGKRGGLPATTWGGVGLGGEWAEREVTLHGRNSASGTWGYFKSTALLKGDYRTTMQEHPGSRKMVEAVAADVAGIGFTGIGYLRPGVRALALADGDGKPVEPISSITMVGSYPLARFFYLYLNRKPGAPPDVVSAFVKYALSNAGQKIVIKDGYIPLDAATGATQREALE